jgi:hypothetical protein
MLAQYILVIFVYAGVMAKGDSVAITAVPGFGSIQQCQIAGEEAKKLANNTFKEVKYTCLKQ